VPDLPRRDFEIQNSVEKVQRFIVPGRRPIANRPQVANLPYMRTSTR
jgi:hypothetical protein